MQILLHIFNWYFDIATPILLSFIMFCTLSRKHDYHKAFYEIHILHIIGNRKFCPVAYKLSIDNDRNFDCSHWYKPRIDRYGSLSIYHPVQGDSRRHVSVPYRIGMYHPYWVVYCSTTNLAKNTCDYRTSIHLSLFYNNHLSQSSDY